jgi:hypothetical protein
MKRHPFFLRLPLTFFSVLFFEEVPFFFQEAGERLAFRKERRRKAEQEDGEPKSKTKEIGIVRQFKQ